MDVAHFLCFMTLLASLRCSRGNRLKEKERKKEKHSTQFLSSWGFTKVWKRSLKLQLNTTLPFAICYSCLVLVRYIRWSRQESSWSHGFKTTWLPNSLINLWWTGALHEFLVVDTAWSLSTPAFYVQIASFSRLAWNSDGLFVLLYLRLLQECETTAHHEGRCGLDVFWDLMHRSKQISAKGTAGTTILLFIS